MDNFYADSVRLLLSIAPDVFPDGTMALKGGTAINLFVHQMPRLSVDLDLVLVDWRLSRAEALIAIQSHLDHVWERLARRGFDLPPRKRRAAENTKLSISRGDVQVLVEVNHILRGTVLPVTRRPLVRETSEMFGIQTELPILAAEELYGGKIVAAMDRQHPRDLFDIWQMYERGGLTDGAVECFVTYLAGHNRPPGEVLFPNRKDIEPQFTSDFVGMNVRDAALDTLLEFRERLFDEIPARLTPAHREFLRGLSRAEPDWSLLACPHAAELPALRWKLQNIRLFREKQRAKFEAQATELERRLDAIGG